MRRYLVTGLLLWIVGTALIRWAPVRLPAAVEPIPILALYAASFAIVFAFVRRAVTRPLSPGEAAAAAIALVLPTLVLDAFTSAFFPAVYPNQLAQAAGVFGGWMLICCAGGLSAAIARRR